MHNLKNEALTITKNAFIAAKIAQKLDAITKNKVLQEVKNQILQQQENIIKFNQIDIKNAIDNGIDQAKIDRLKLDTNKIQAIAASIDEIILKDDPVGKVIFETNRANGLNIKRVTTPIGVMLAIYESRPNVTVDVAALAIKSGNVAILRCGSEAVNSSKIFADIFQIALINNNLDKNIISFCDNTERALIKYLLRMDKYIDVVIPRGGKSLILAITKNTRIPVFKHLDGNCHTYIHEDADFEKARKILINAKMRRVSICGATESLLIDKKIAAKILPLIINDLNDLGCEIRADALSCKIDPRLKKAKIKDYYTEYLDKIISLKIVKNIDEAINHIEKYGSSHTESIVTENNLAAQKFLNEVNSAIIMHNSSTQFADGGEFGFGAEVGIATGKLHARGPIGLEQLTTFKYQVSANCAIRQ